VQGGLYLFKVHGLNLQRATAGFRGRKNIQLRVFGEISIDPQIAGQRQALNRRSQQVILLESSYKITREFIMIILGGRLQN
jgi:hypothetical protein